MVLICLKGAKERDSNLVEYKGVQIWKNEADVLYALKELTNREFSFGKDSFFFFKTHFNGSYNIQQ